MVLTCLYYSRISYIQLIYTDCSNNRVTLQLFVKTPTGESYYHWAIPSVFGLLYRRTNPSSHDGRECIPSGYVIHVPSRSTGRKSSHLESLPTSHTAGNANGSSRRASLALHTQLQINSLALTDHQPPLSVYRPDTLTPVQISLTRFIASGRDLMNVGIPSVAVGIARSRYLVRRQSMAGHAR